MPISSSVLGLASHLSLTSRLTGCRQAVVSGTLLELQSGIEEAAIQTVPMLCVLDPCRAD